MMKSINFLQLRRAGLPFLTALPICLALSLISPSASAREIPTVSILVQARTGFSSVSVPGAGFAGCKDCYYMGTAGLAMDVMISPLRELIPTKVTSADWLGMHFKVALDAAFDQRGAPGGRRMRVANSSTEYYPWVAPGDIQFELGLVFGLDGKPGNAGPRLGVSWGFGSYWGWVQGNGLFFSKAIVDFQYLRIAGSPVGLGVGLEIPFYIQGEQGLYNAFQPFSPSTPLQVFYVPWQVVISISFQFDVKKGLIPVTEVQ